MFTEELLKKWGDNLTLFRIDETQVDEFESDFDCRFENGIPDGHNKLRYEMIRNDEHIGDVQVRQPTEEEINGFEEGI